MFRRLMIRPRSIRHQLVFGVALVHALLMAIFVFDLVVKQRTFLHHQSRQQSTAVVERIARSAQPHLMSGDLAALHDMVAGFNNYPELRYAAIIDPSGQILAHTKPSLAGLYMSDPLSRKFLEGAAGLTTLVETDDILDLAYPIQWDERVIGWVRFSAGMEGNERGLNSVAREGALYTVMAIAIGVALAVWMARAVTRRVYELLKVAQATREGRRDVRAQADDVNEIGRLAASFNAMLDVLSERERALQEANAGLEARVAARTAALNESEATQRAILEQANDAFVSMDGIGQVVAWNGTAETIFGWRREEVFGQQLAELIIPPDLREAHKAGMARFLATGEMRVINRRVELTALRRDGSTFPVEMSLRVRSRGGQNFFDAFLHDISERKQMEERLARQALEDALTGLPNRRALMGHLPAAIARANRSQQSLALMFLDLDGFKGVNDRLGHDAGDEVLREFGRRLKGAVRITDFVARLAGDEFVVVVEALTAPEDAHVVAGKILEAAARPFVLGDEMANLSSSIGIELFAPGSDATADSLVTQADNAMYAAKHAGKGRFELGPHAQARLAPSAE